jgi:hypothetical protein
VAQNKVFYPEGKTIYRYDLVTGEYDGWFTTTNFDIHGVNWDGQDMCIHDEANSKKIECFRVLDENSYDDVHPERVAESLGGQLNPFGAAAGTGYVEANHNPPSKRELKENDLQPDEEGKLVVNFEYTHMDNEGFNVPGATVILEDNQTHYEFALLELTGHSRVKIYSPEGTNATVIAHKFIGDKTGLCLLN